MAGIYIPGMEMPIGTSKITIEIGADGFTVERETGSGNKYLGPKIYHAIPVPDHGRLIDADVLCNRLLTAWDTADKEKKTLISAVMADVVTPIVVGTPTIIPADGGAE